MNQFPKTLALTACALAVSLVITACGGGTATDTTPPTVAITSATSGSTATFTFTFSEDVGTSFDASDVVVTGGTSAASVTKVDATRYTLVVTPAGSGDVTVSLAAAKFKDLAMNDNTATATAGYTPPAPVVTAGVTFDESTAPTFAGFDGAEGSAIETGPAGGSGKALKILRSGGQVWAGAKVTGLSIPLSSTNTTITARVYSPAAGIPFVLKMEGGGGASAEYQATTAVAVGWQTLTWVLAGADLKSWTDAVFLPNLGTLGTGEAYYVDNITGVTYTPPAPVVTAGVTFDESTAPTFVGFDGAEGSAIETGPAGGSGKALKILRSGGQVWAGAKVTGLSIPLSSTNTTITARVYSPAAGIPFVLKMEGGGGASAEYQATTAVAVGWQTLTWVLAGADLKSWTDAVFLPNLGTLGTGEAYYVDNITGVTFVPPVNTDAVTGSGGAQTLAVSTGDSKGLFASGEWIFADDYVGGAEANGNLASYTGARTAGSSSGGRIGYYVGGELLAGTNSLEQGGWVVGTSMDPGGTPNFFRYAVLTGTAANFANSWMGMYVNAPNNGTVDVSTKGNLKFRLWGPAEMYQQNNLNPTIEVVLVGPKVSGCTTTGSGSTEIKKTFVADKKIGAGSSYLVSLAGFTVNGVCGSDTNGTAVASVLSQLAAIAFNVLPANFNFTNANPGTPVSYSTGLNIGPIGFTN